MKRYFINEVKCGESEGGVACGPMSGSLVATVKYTAADVTQWLSLVEFDGFPNFYLADKDFHDNLVKEDFNDEEFTQYLEDHQIDEFDGVSIGGEYDDLFEGLAEAGENPAVAVIRYLVALIRCDEADVDGLIRMAQGEYADELDIPMSDLEEECTEYDENEEFELELPENMEKEALFRMRLSLETDVETDSVFHDLDDNNFRAEKAHLQAVIDKCKDEMEYKTWKESFVSSEYEKIKNKKFITCSYAFAGIGQYEITIPVEVKDDFICWIDGNGSAFYGGDIEATEDEIKRYIALNASKDNNE